MYKQFTKNFMVIIYIIDLIHILLKYFDLY